MPPPLCAVVHFVLLHHVQAERGQLAARLRDECVITFRTSLLLDLTTVEVQLIDAAATISGARKMAPTRVILMSCGSYNPPTNMHLRMFGTYISIYFWWRLTVMLLTLNFYRAIFCHPA